MLTRQIDLDTFIYNLREMINTVVVKRDKEAAKYETVATRTLADQYIAMKDGSYDFNSFGAFDSDVLAAAGMNSRLISMVLANGKDAIPYEFRNLVVQLQHDKIIDTYVEQNTYYRMLAGLPPIDATEDDFIYAPKDNKYEIPSDTPIHLLDDSYREYFNTTPLREQLYKENPDKEYILHLGSHSIDYYRSRSALNYEILYVNRCENPFIAVDFMKNYGAARNYVMLGLYNKADQKTYENYDAYMGFLVMTMAIHRTFTSVFKQGITRDFYDDNLIRYLLQAYNVQYIESIDTNYQRRIAKRLNVLLQKKSTNMVLYDIADLFEYKVNIYKYYLMKDYKKDVDGNPIFIYHTVYDENNQPHEVLDPEKTYDIYFQKVNIRSKDPTAELSNIQNRIEYNALCGGDPYWIEDSDLINKIYNSKFNATMTKYMSIDISYELSKIMYETSYCVRMMIDDQKEYKLITVKLPWVSEPVSLFDVIVFLCALVAKKFNLAGNVPLKPYQIAQVYGFNFKQDIPMIKQSIIESLDSKTGEYRFVREELLDKLNELHADTLDGARKMFNDINGLRKWLDTAMRTTSNLIEYEAYRKIYQACLVVRDVQELYTKNDGTYASTFAELLKSRRQDLYAVLLATGDITAKDDVLRKHAYSTLNNRINKVLDVLSDLAEELKDLRYMNDKEAMVNNIEKLINQMKSYTVDQTASNVLYLVNDPHLCLLKILDFMAGANKITSLDDKIQSIFMDVIDSIMPRRTWPDKMTIRNKLESDIWVSTYEVIRLANQLTSAKMISPAVSSIMLYDAFHSIAKSGLMPDKMIKLMEQLRIFITVNCFDTIDLNDLISSVRFEGTYDAWVNFTDSHGARIHRSKEDFLDALKDQIDIYLTMSCYEILRFPYDLWIQKHRTGVDELMLYDSDRETKHGSYNGYIDLQEEVHSFMRVYIEEYHRFIFYQLLKNISGTYSGLLRMYDTNARNVLEDHHYRMRFYKKFDIFPRVDCYENIKPIVEETLRRVYGSMRSILMAYDAAGVRVTENQYHHLNYGEYQISQHNTYAWDILKFFYEDFLKETTWNIHAILSVYDIAERNLREDLYYHMALRELNQITHFLHGWETIGFFYQRTMEYIQTNYRSILGLHDTGVKVSATPLEEYHSFMHDIIAYTSSYAGSTIMKRSMHEALHMKPCEYFHMKHTYGMKEPKKVKETNGFTLRDSLTKVTV